MKTYQGAFAFLRVRKSDSTKVWIWMDLLIDCDEGRQTEAFKGTLGKGGSNTMHCSVNKFEIRRFIVRSKNAFVNHSVIQWQ